MTQKLPCSECGVLILPATATKNSGLCMPCKNGYRKNIEQAREHYKKERELDAHCPYRALWRNLVKQVFESPEGFDSLSEDEKQYFAVGVLDGDVYNGGFVQYFHNSSGDYYTYSELGLMRIGAREALRLLREAKVIAFGNATVPKDEATRREHADEAIKSALDNLDSRYYELNEDVGELLYAFARETGLVAST